MTLRSTGTTDITVDLAPGSLRGHSEESLARQVNATMRVALVAYQQASRTLLDAELAALESG